MMNIIYKLAFLKNISGGSHIILYPHLQVCAAEVFPDISFQCFIAEFLSIALRVIDIVQVS